MSAYVVDNKTINGIVNGLWDKVMAGLSIINGPSPEGVLAVREAEEAAALGAMMYNVNVESVLHRYDGDKTMIPQEGYTFASISPPSDAQLYKSIHCWMYQSCEAEETRNDPVYLALTEYAKNLAEHIVSNLPEYEAAEWA